MFLLAAGGSGGGRKLQEGGRGMSPILTLDLGDRSHCEVVARLFELLIVYILIDGSPESRRIFTVAVAGPLGAATVTGSRLSSRRAGTLMLSSHPPAGTVDPMTPVPRRHEPPPIQEHLICASHRVYAATK